ncbi:MAG: YbaB/EbfC family nucleoid-associated protein [Actinobacteria bacterium]|nr:YbaB/EbfC family nucleoid-associated protein [Actinomycetota bacterium]
MAKQKPTGGQGAPMDQMMRQVQKMQADMAAAQAALADETVEVSAGGGMVKAVVTGTGEIRSVSIDAKVVDPDDVEMLEDLVVSICNEAQRAAQTLQSQRMGAVAGGLELPPGLDGLLG